MNRYTGLDQLSDQAWIISKGSDDEFMRLIIDLGYSDAELDSSDDDEDED